MFHHRVNQPALQLQPVVALPPQLRDRMLAEKFGRDLLLCRFTSEGLNAVLAKLEDAAVIVRARPRAALTIEPILLVDPEPITNPAGQTGFANGKAQTFGQRLYPRGHTMWLT